MRMNQRRTAIAQQALIGAWIPGNHLPADARQRPPRIEVLQGERVRSGRRRAEPHASQIQRLVPPQLLCLLGDKRFRDLEEVMAEYSYLAHWRLLIAVLSRQCA